MKSITNYHYEPVPLPRLRLSTPGDHRAQVVFADHRLETQKDQLLRGFLRCRALGAVATPEPPFFGAPQGRGFPWWAVFVAGAVAWLSTRTRLHAMKRCGYGQGLDHHYGDNHESHCHINMQKKGVRFCGNPDGTMDDVMTEIAS